jgi:hypothetical protein
VCFLLSHPLTPFHCPLLYVFVSSLSHSYVFISSFHSMLDLSSSRPHPRPPSPAAPTDTSIAAAARQCASSSLYFLDNSTREISAYSSTSASATWWSRAATRRIRHDIDEDDDSRDQLDAVGEDGSNTTQPLSDGQFKRLGLY